MQLWLENCRAELQAAELEVRQHKHKLRETEVLRHEKRMKSMPAMTLSLGKD